MLRHEGARAQRQTAGAPDECACEGESVDADLRERDRRRRTSPTSWFATPSTCARSSRRAWARKTPMLACKKSSSAALEAASTTDRSCSHPSCLLVCSLRAAVLVGHAVLLFTVNFKCAETVCIQEQASPPDFNAHLIRNTRSRLGSAPVSRVTAAP